MKERVADKIAGNELAGSSELLMRTSSGGNLGDGKKHERGRSPPGLHREFRGFDTNAARSRENEEA